MANPGRDIFNLQADDVLAPELAEFAKRATRSRVPDLGHDIGARAG
jgi:hypothetical protein